MWIETANKCTKFYAKRLNPSENIVESRRRATFLTHPVYTDAFRAIYLITLWNRENNMEMYFLVRCFIKLWRWRNPFSLLRVYNQDLLVPKWRHANKHVVADRRGGAGATAHLTDRDTPGWSCECATSSSCALLAQLIRQLGDADTLWYIYLTPMPLGSSYSVSQKNPPKGFWQFFQSGWDFFDQILHTYYSFLTTLEYKFLFNYLELWRSYAMLSATIQRVFRSMVDILSMVVALNMA